MFYMLIYHRCLSIQSVIVNWNYCVSLRIKSMVSEKYSHKFWATPIRYWNKSAGTEGNQKQREHFFEPDGFLSYGAAFYGIKVTKGFLPDSKITP